MSGRLAAARVGVKVSVRVRGWMRMRKGGF